MYKILKNLLILGILVQTIFAAQTLAVLEIIPTTEELNVSTTEMRHMTDELRRQAVQALPGEDYAVLTRDNMYSLLPPDSEEAECLAESCAVEIGRAIGAEYISQGSIGTFGGDLSLSIELYETMSGKLLGSIVMESSDVKSLMEAIRKQAPGLFARIKSNKVESKGNLAIKEQKLSDNSKLSTFNSQLEKKSPTSFYIALSLDLLGAAALGFGIYQHFQKNKLYDEYEKMIEGKPGKEYDKAYKKADDARVLRDIGLITGGILLGTGIAVHIWF